MTINHWVDCDDIEGAWVILKTLEANPKAKVKKDIDSRPHNEKYTSKTFYDMQTKSIEAWNEWLRKASHMIMYASEAS